MISARILWRATPLWVKAALAAALAGAFMFYAGVTHERIKAKQRAAEARIDNIKDAREIERDVEALDDADLGTELDGRLSAPRE